MDRSRREMVEEHELERRNRKRSFFIFLTLIEGNLFEISPIDEENFHGDIVQSSSDTSTKVFVHGDVRRRVQSVESSTNSSDLNRARRNEWRRRRVKEIADLLQLQIRDRRDGRSIFSSGTGQYSSIFLFVPRPAMENSYRFMKNMILIPWKRQRVSETENTYWSYVVRMTGIYGWSSLILFLDEKSPVTINCLFACVSAGSKKHRRKILRKGHVLRFFDAGNSNPRSSWPRDPFLRVLLGATVNSQSESSFEKSAYLGVSRCGELESEASLRKSCLDIGYYVFIINSLLTNHIFDETRTTATKHGESEFEVDFIHYMLISFNW